MDKISDTLILSMNSLVETWILDSGASFRSYPSREIMESYIFGSFGKVYLADNEALKIVGKKNIRINTPNGHVSSQSVRHIFGLKRNLIFGGQLDDEEYTVSFMYSLHDNEQP